MADEGVFKVVIQADKTEAVEAFDEAGAAGEQMGDRLTVSFEQASGVTRRAMRQISDDTKEMAASVTADELKAAEATRARTAAQKEAAAAKTLQKQGDIDSAAADALVAATTRQVTEATLAERAALQALLPAQEASVAASHSMVSGQQATSAAIRALEGNAGLRAVENFTAKTLGLGPALQAVFPLVGAFAFGKILFDVGEKAVEVEEKARKAGKAITEAFADAHEKAQVANDDLAIQNDKLGDEIAKLSGRPGNGLQTALDEGRKMADRLLESLQADRKELAALLKEHEVTGLGQVLSGVASTGVQASQMEKDQASLTAAVRKAKSDYEAELLGATSQDAIKAAGDKRDRAVRAAFEAQITTYRTEAKRLKDEQAASERDRDVANTSGEGSFAVGATDNSAKIANIEGRAQQLQDALTREGLAESIATREATVGSLKARKEGASEANKQAELELKADEAQLAQKKIWEGLSLEQEYDFWEAKKAAFAAGSAQYNTVVEKQATLSVEMDKKVAAAFKKAEEETRKRHLDQGKLDTEGSFASSKGTDGIAKWATETGNNLFQTGAKWDSYWKEVSKGEEISAAVAESISMAQLRALEASGGITRLGAAQVEAALHAREHAAALAVLQAELDQLERAATKGKNPITGQDEYTDPKQAADIQRVKNQISQQKGKGTAQGITDASAIQQQVVAPYKKAFDTIASDFNSTVLSILKGQDSIAQGAKKMAANELAQGAQALLQLGEKHLAHYLFVDALHLGSATKKAAIDATSNATQLSTAATTNSAEVLSLAAVAAAAAFASTAAIPVVGLALAPEAASAAYASTAAFAGLAAFELGTPMVPRDGIAMLHKGEAVLDSPSAGAMREMLGGGKRRGGDVNLHLGGNQFTAAGSDFKQQFAQHQDHVRAQVKRWMRDGQL